VALLQPIGLKAGSSMASWTSEEQNKPNTTQFSPRGWQELPVGSLVSASSGDASWGWRCFTALGFRAVTGSKQLGQGDGNKTIFGCCFNSV